jgi:hypothetical protein
LDAQERSVDRFGEMIEGSLIQNVGRIHFARRMRSSLVRPDVKFLSDPREDPDRMVVQRASKRHWSSTLDIL